MINDFLSLLNISSGGTSYWSNRFSKEFATWIGAGNLKFKPGFCIVFTGLPNWRITTCSVSSTVKIVDNMNRVNSTPKTIVKFSYLMFCRKLQLKILCHLSITQYLISNPCFKGRDAQCFLILQKQPFQASSS